MKKKIQIFILLNFIISGNIFSQQVDFKLLKAIKSSELTIERSFGSELFNETDVLPDGKKFLLIMAEVTNNGEQTISLKSENVNIGTEKIEAIGYLRPSSRADVQWGFKGNLWKGNNYFTALFIVDSDVLKTTLNINEQSFVINKIEDSQFPSFCLPKSSLIEKEYLSEFSYESHYRKGNNQTFNKVIKPISGKILKLSISVEFCDKVVLNKRKSFVFQPSYFQIEDERGTNFECIGTLSYGKVDKSTIPYNIGGGRELKSDLTLLFNVSGEGKYKLKYLGEEIDEL